MEDSSQGFSYITNRKDKPGELGHWRLFSRGMSEVSWEQVETEMTLQDLKGALKWQLSRRAKFKELDIHAGQTLANSIHQDHVDSTQLGPCNIDCKNRDDVLQRRPRRQKTIERKPGMFPETVGSRSESL